MGVGGRRDFFGNGLLGYGLGVGVNGRYRYRPSRPNHNRLVKKVYN